MKNLFLVLIVFFMAGFGFSELQATCALSSTTAINTSTKVPVGAVPTSKLFVESIKKRNALAVENDINHTGNTQSPNATAQKALWFGIASLLLVLLSFLFLGFYFGIIVALLLADIPGIIFGWIAISNARKVLRKKTKDNFTDQMRTKARWGLLLAIAGILIHSLIIGAIILAISILGI